MKHNYRYWAGAQELLPKLGVHDTIVLNMYNQDHRFYHNWGHIEDLISQIQEMKLCDHDYSTMFLAAVFHDAVYDPKADNNEYKSAAIFEEIYKGDDDKLKKDVIQIILDTQHHKPSSELSRIFCEMDMDILSRPLDKLIEYENKIFREFQFADWKDYKRERVKVLRSLQKASELESLISYVESRKPSIAVYPGSFNPMSKGHYNILQKAEQIFDKVIIARGVNQDKSAELRELPKKVQFRQIETYDGLLTDFINGLGYDVTVVRGLRNATDLQYEVTQYRFLQDLKPDIKIVSLFCDKEYEHISSSAIRMLEKYGKEKDYLI